MNISFVSLVLFFLIQSGELHLVKRQSSINNVCISTKADEYYIVGSFYKQFNEKNKYTDAFNSLNNLNTSEWSSLRISEQYVIDANTNLLIPNGFSSTTGAKFSFKVKNDQNSTYQVYWVTGKLSSYGTVKPGSTWSIGSYVGHCWYFYNLNTSKVLAFRIGEAPFLSSNTTYNVSQIKKTNYDYIKAPYMFYVNGLNGSTDGRPFVPSGVVSSTNGTEFLFTLNNDLSDTYSGYMIDTNGNPVLSNTILPGSTFTQSSYFGFVWFLQNTNPSKKETLYIKLGEVPFVNSGVIVKLSDILSTVEDIIPLNSLQVYSSRQSFIGDCYMLQCLISMYARYPEKIVSKFIYPSKFKSTGVAVIKVWNSTKGCWTPFVLDDYIPRSGSWYYGTSASDNNEYWTTFLEKVFAKINGDYPNLAAGSSNVSVKDVYQTVLGPIKYFTFSISYQDPSLTGFNKLLNYYKNGTVMSLTSRTCGSSGSTTGLVCYHGYGLLNIIENVAGTNFTFVKAHNPWSHAGEWNGSWSDSSTLWDLYPDVKAALGYENKDDGTFFVEKFDFATAFQVVWAAQIL